MGAFRLMCRVGVRGLGALAEERVCGGGYSGLGSWWWVAWAGLGGGGWFFKEVSRPRACLITSSL